MAEWVEHEVGLRFPRSGEEWEYWDILVRDAKHVPIEKLLDLITEVANFLDVVDYKERREIWLSSARRIFAEEHLAFHIDADGSIHPAVDEEFQRNRLTTLQGLQAPRYANARALYDRISDELVSDPPNPKQAWRAVFSAVECVFRLMTNAPQLTNDFVRERLGPLIERRYKSESGRPSSGQQTPKEL